jgi:hypothetical protein
MPLSAGICANYTGLRLVNPLPLSEPLPGVARHNSRCISCSRASSHRTTFPPLAPSNSHSQSCSCFRATQFASIAPHILPSGPLSGPKMERPGETTVASLAVLLAPIAPLILLLPPKSPKIRPFWTPIAPKTPPVCPRKMRRQILH